MPKMKWDSNIDLKTKTSRLDILEMLEGELGCTLDHNVPDTRDAVKHIEKVLRLDTRQFVRDTVKKVAKAYRWLTYPVEEVKND